MWSDAELIAGCIKEDRAAQQALYECFASKLLGVCFRYVRSKFEAEDVLQDGFIKVYNNIASFRQESSLETWMTRIMVNTALNHIKTTEKFRKEEMLENVLCEETITAELFHQFDSKVIMQCIQELPAGYRVVLNMYAIEGYSHKEIAKALGINEGTSRSQFVRAKALLEKKISSLGFNNDQQYAGERV